MKNQTATVLIVEDDPALNEAYRMILRSRSGLTVRSAFNGQEALDSIKDEGNTPDIILLDLRMPVMDGIGFLKEFKPLSHPECTVIVFSNYDAHKDIDEAYSLGVDRYVLKARVAPKDLVHLVEGVLGERSAVKV